MGIPWCAQIRDIFVHAPNDVVGHRLFNFLDLHGKPPRHSGALHAPVEQTLTAQCSTHFRHSCPQGLSRAAHDPILCFKKRKTPLIAAGSGSYTKRKTTTREPRPNRNGRGSGNPLPSSGGMSGRGSASATHRQGKRFLISLAASSWRTQTSQPRDSRHNRASCDPHGGRRPASTSTAFYRQGGL